MPMTSCEYVLFGERHLQDSLRDVLRHVLPELNRRNPSSLRVIAASGWYDWLYWRGGEPFHLRQRYRDILKLDPDLWANVRWATQENLERVCRELVRRLELSGPRLRCGEVRARTRRAR